MENAIQKVIEHELKFDFYFIQLQNRIPDYVWKSRDGDFVLMDDMSLEHLKACINNVDNAIARLAKSNRRIEVKEALMPCAEQKLNELKECFSRKSCE